MAEILKKYKWMGPIIAKMDRDIKMIFMKNFRYRNKDFFPKGEYKADVKNLANCMNCPNMCRFECGTLQAGQKEKNIETQRRGSWHPFCQNLWER